MRLNRTPPHHDGSGGNDEDDIMTEDIEDTFDDDDMIEIHDDDENDETDLGDFADDEEDDMDGEPGPGMEGFSGQKPDFVLTSHQGTLIPLKYISKFRCENFPLLKLVSLPLGR